jgi:hypothetical protein
VAEIHGDKRVEGVTVTEVDAGWNPIAGTKKFIECDTLLLSVGLIPENELSKMAGVSLDPMTGGAYVNEFLETDVPGIFSCGNVLHVNDYVDEVSTEGEIAARGAQHRIKGKLSDAKKLIAIDGDETIGQIVPQAISGQRPVTFYIRVKRPMEKLTLRIGDIFDKKFAYARPSEMMRVRLPKKLFAEMKPTVTRLNVSCEER